MADSMGLRCCTSCDNTNSRSFYPLSFIAAMMQRLCLLTISSSYAFIAVTRTLVTFTVWNLNSFELCLRRELLSASQAVFVCVWKDGTEEIGSISGRDKDLDYSGLNSSRNPRPLSSEELHLQSVPRSLGEEASPWTKVTRKMFLNPMVLGTVQLLGRVVGALQCHRLRACCGHNLTVLKTTRCTRLWRCLGALVFFLLVPNLPSATAARHKDSVTMHDGGDKRHLYIVGLFPFTGPLGSVGRGVRPAVELALRHVNDDKSVLPGVTLHMSYNDTEVSDVTVASICIFFFLCA